MTFNAVGIGQTTWDPGIWSNGWRYNSTDHVNSGDAVGNYGMQLGSTEVHIDDSEIDFSKVDYTELSRALIAKYQGAFGQISLFEREKIINQVVMSASPETLAVLRGYRAIGGQSNGPASFHNIDTFVDDDGNLTPTTTIQQDYLNILSGVYGLLDALVVIEKAKQENNYTTDSVTVFSSPDIRSFGGSVYFKAGTFDATNPLHITYTYTHDQIAYANFIAKKVARDLQSGKLTEAAIELQKAGVSEHPRVDPLIIDLDGDGIETTSLVGSNAFFDLDNNGLAENTSWVGNHDGLLVLDRNGDGVINNGNELFGDRTLLSDGTYAPSGFAALAEYDTNADGKIDANDSIYSLLRIWQDLDSDGVTDAGELKSLLEWGIVSIGLTYQNTGFMDSADNIQIRSSETTWSDGGVKTIGEYLLNRDVRQSIEESITNVSAAIALLPDIQGAGEVVSLRKALVDDTSGQLQALVENFVAASDISTRESTFQQILFTWAGVDSIDPASRGGLFDAQKLAVMERFYGVGFEGNPTRQAALSFLSSSYFKLFETLYADMISKTHVKDLLALVTETTDGTLSFDTVRTVIDTQLANSQADGITALSEFSRIVRQYGLAGTSSFVDFRSHYAVQSELYAKTIDLAGTRLFSGDAGDNTIANDGFRGAIDGGDGNDSLYADQSSSVLYGGVGDDTIFGSAQSDYITGGVGNDYLEGKAGNDTYTYYPGGGSDVIYDIDGTVGNVDTLQFLGGIAPEDVAVRRAGSDLVFSIIATGDTVTIQHYFSGIDKYLPWYYGNGFVSADAAKIEQVVFTDGTVWNGAQLAEKVRYIDGTDNSESLVGYNEQHNIINGKAGDDTIYAGAMGDELYGGTGNDELYGNHGDDLIDGGVGNDYLEGKAGNDTYIFARGYGSDTIYDIDATVGNTDKIILGDDINPDDIVVRRVSNDLELTIKGTSDSLTIQHYFSGIDKYLPWYYGNGFVGQDAAKIEQIVFSDGTIWDTDTLINMARTIRGTENAEGLVGYDDQHNIIFGEAGDDVLYAGVKGDSLYGGVGNDSLYGSNYGSDILAGGEGDDYLEGKAGNDTYLFGRGDGSDVIYDLDTTLGNLDKVLFGEDIQADDIAVRRNSNDLELRITGTNDILTIQHYFSGIDKYMPSYYGNGFVGADAAKVEQFVFQDGTVWDGSVITEKAKVITGTGVNDWLYGFNEQHNTINGGAGDDYIVGGVLGDVITGGSGSDEIHGGVGDDTYVFNTGDGQDIIYESSGHDSIQFGEGINPEDVSVRRVHDLGTSSYNLELSIGTDGDKITVWRQFGYGYYSIANSSEYLVDQITFVDGTIWTMDTLNYHTHHLTGTDNADSLVAYDDGDVVYHGQGGDDYLYGAAGNDTLYGDAGNDTIYASYGNDTLYGGADNDTLEGGYGDDTYVFNIGDGKDIIQESSGIDTIQFGAGIGPSDVRVSRVFDQQSSNSYNLELELKDTGDKITVWRYFGYGYYSISAAPDQMIEQITFSDGTIWNQASISDMIHHRTGTNDSDAIVAFDDGDVVYQGLGGDDYLYGNVGDDTLRGDEGNDTLYGSYGSDALFGGTGNDNLDGGYGDDTLTGGAGDDYLDGGYGNDTYVFGIGSGSDVIYDYSKAQGDVDVVSFLEGVNPEDIIVSRTGGYQWNQNNLVLEIKNTTDKLTISGYFYNGIDNPGYQISEFKFVDGTVWAHDDIKEKLRTYTGTEGNDTNLNFGDQDLTAYGLEGNDTLYGSSYVDQFYGGSGDDYLYGGYGNDYLVGGEGNDILDGSYGDDTYVFNGSFGSDHISEYTGNDLAVFDKTQDDLIFEQVNNTLRISVSGATDSVSIDYWFSSNDHKIETIKSSNGSTISSTQVEQLIQAMASWSSNNNGMSWSQALSSNPQDVQSIVSQYWTAPTA